MRLKIQFVFRCNFFFFCKLITTATAMLDTYNHKIKYVTMPVKIWNGVSLFHIVWIIKTKNFINKSLHHATKYKMLLLCKIETNFFFFCGNPDIRNATLHSITG